MAVAVEKLQTGVVLCQEMAAPALAPDSGPALTRQPTEAEVTKAANAILSELRDTKDTSTTSPVELSWLGELMSAHETSGAACPATSSLMRCSTCRRLVLSARAGLHKQQCGAAKPQKQQQAKPVPSRPPRQVAPPPPQATVVPRATAVKSKPRPPVPVDLDLARPTKLSKVTYPAVVSVASKSYVPDFTAVPKRPRAHIPRRPRANIDISWMHAAPPPPPPQPTYIQPSALLRKPSVSTPWGARQQQMLGALDPIPLGGAADKKARNLIGPSGRVSKVKMLDIPLTTGRSGGAGARGHAAEPAGSGRPVRAAAAAAQSNITALSQILSDEGFGGLQGYGDFGLADGGVLAPPPPPFTKAGGGTGASQAAQSPGASAADAAGGARARSNGAPLRGAALRAHLNSKAKQQAAQGGQSGRPQEHLAPQPHIQPGTNPPSLPPMSNMPFNQYNNNYSHFSGPIPHMPPPSAQQPAASAPTSFQAAMKAQAAQFAAQQRASAAAQNKTQQPRPAAAAAPHAPGLGQAPQPLPHLTLPQATQQSQPGALPVQSPLQRGLSGGQIDTGGLLSPLSSLGGTGLLGQPQQLSGQALVQSIQQSMPHLSPTQMLVLQQAVQQAAQQKQLQEQQAAAAAAQQLGLQQQVLQQLLGLASPPGLPGAAAAATGTTPAQQSLFGRPQANSLPAGMVPVNQSPLLPGLGSGMVPMPTMPGFPHSLTGMAGLPSLANSPYSQASLLGLQNMLGGTVPQAHTSQVPGRNAQPAPGALFGRSGLQ